MNIVRQAYSIRDLENLTGIKAHTIRIWEKRYALLQPERSATNIRQYSLPSLQKLLNIALLYQNGFKISKIASISDAEMAALVFDLTQQDNQKELAIQEFKIAMLEFNAPHFEKTYLKLKKTKNLEQLIYQVCLPLLFELRILWQTNGISEANVNFITGLLKQKILAETARLKRLWHKCDSRTFVPYLPFKDMFEMGLLFTNHEILRLGHRSIYLDQRLPIENLLEITNCHDNLHFVTYFTILPSKNRLVAYMNRFENFLIKNKLIAKLHLLGCTKRDWYACNKSPNIILYPNVKEFTQQL